MPRTASSPRSGLSNIPSAGEYTPGLSGSGDESKQRSLRKKYTVVNGTPTTTTPSTTITSSSDQQQVSRSVPSRSVCYLQQEKRRVSTHLWERKKKRGRRKRTACIFHPSRTFLSLSLDFSSSFSFLVLSIDCIMRVSADGRRKLSRQRKSYHKSAATAISSREQYPVTAC